MNELIDYNKWAIKKKILNRKIACDKTFNEELMSFIDSKVATDKDQHKRAAAHRINIDKEMRRSDALLEIRRVINNLNKKDLNDIQVQYAIGILEDVRKRIRGNDVIQISVASQKIDKAKGILVALEEYSGISERQDIGLLNNAKACVERILLYDDVIFNQYMQSAKAHLKEMKAYREEHP